MNKISSTAMVSALFVTSAVSADFIKGDFYGGAGIGVENFSHYSSYDPGVTVVVNGGKPIIKLGPGTIGAEGELTYTVVPLSHSFGDDLSIFTLSAFATYTFDHTDKIYTRVKAGFTHRNYSFDNESFNSNYNSRGVAAGVGAGYKLSDNIGLFSDLVLVDGSNLTQVNFGAKMNF
jgi:hypothetical protein